MMGMARRSSMGRMGLGCLASEPAQADTTRSSEAVANRWLMLGPRLSDGGTVRHSRATNHGRATIHGSVFRHSTTPTDSGAKVVRSHEPPHEGRNWACVAAIGVGARGGCPPARRV